MVSHIAELSLVPKSVVVHRSGTVVARTAQGFVLGAPGSDAATRAVAVARGRPAVLVRADPAWWLTVEARGRIVSHAADGTETEVACVPDADDVFTVDGVALVSTSSSEYHGFVLPSGPTERLTAVGSVGCAVPDDGIGLVLNTAASDGCAWAAVVAQSGTTLTARVARLTSSAFSVEWTADLEMPSDDVPAAWALSADGAKLCIVPKDAAPIVVRPSGSTPIAALAPKKGVATQLFDVAALGAAGFIFAVNAALRNDTIAIVAVRSSGAPVEVARLTGVAFRKSLTVNIAAHNRASHLGLIVGRDLHSVAVPAGLRASADDDQPRADEAAAGPVDPTKQGLAAVLAGLQAAPNQDSAKRVAAAAKKGDLREPVNDQEFAADGGVHAVLDLLSDSAPATECYACNASNVGAATVLRVLVAGASLGAEECAKRAGRILEAAAQGGVVGALPPAWRAVGTAAAAAPVFTAVYAVLLHAIATGRLAVVRLAVGAMDAIVIAHATTLTAECAATLRNARAVIADVAAWSHSEPGYRLGQLTAHCGADFTATKEAMAVPHRAHRIQTATSITVVRERHAL